MDEDQTTTLPAGWEWTTVGDIATFRKGRTFTPAERGKAGLLIVGVENLIHGSSSPEYSDFPFPNRYHINNGDLLFAWPETPDTPARAHLWSGGRALLGRNVMRVTPDERVCSKRYFLHLLNQKATVLASDTSGIVKRSDTTKKLERLSVAIPPLREQERITTRIDELFASIENDSATLQATQDDLDAYRQKTLRWAFEGRLTNKRLSEGQLPEGWRLEKLSDLSAKIQTGPRIGSRLSRTDYITGGIGIPLIDRQHLNNGIIQRDPSYSVSTEKRDSLVDYILEEGDVLLGRKCETGKCGLVKEKEAGWCCGTDSLYVRPRSEYVHSPYLFHYLRGPAFGNYLSRMNAGAGTTLSSKMVGEIPVLLPFLPEQIEIVSEIEFRHSVANEVAESIRQALEGIESLRQSIVKQGLDGNLVPQDPNDEPARVLLARARKGRKAKDRAKV
jgi:type I restriction enzyme, S subunit